MSKAAERRTRELTAFKQRGDRLSVMIDSFSAGRDIQPDGNAVNAERIAAEITGKYRPMMTDRNNVNWDGSLKADIERAIEAGIRFGRKKRGE